MELRGNTSVLSLFDLAQALATNEASGMLLVESQNGKGYLYFDRGHIINALDADGQEGEDAAKQVFALQHADYSFVSDLPSVARRITVSTPNLLMEIARQLDEEIAEDRAAHRWREVHEMSSELNELFRQLDHEAGSPRDAPGHVPLLDLLLPLREAPHVSLFLAAGAIPELRDGDRMLAWGDVALEPDAYRELKTELLAASRPFGGPGDTGPDAFGSDLVLDLGIERTFRVDLLGSGDREILTISQIASPGGIETPCPWPGEVLHAFLDRPGSLVLLTGAPGVALDRGFEAACRWVIEAGPRPFLGLARRWSPDLPSGASTLLLSTDRHDEARDVTSAIDRLDPALLAIHDESPGALRQALRGWRRGARGIVAVTSPFASRAPHRLLDALEPAASALLTRHLGECLTGVFRVGPGAGPGRAWGIEEETRLAMLDGDLGSLSRELAEKELVG